MSAYGIPWYGWLMIVLCAFKGVTSPILIGKPQEPLTAGGCVVRIILSALYIWAIVELAT